MLSRTLRTALILFSWLPVLAWAERVALMPGLIPFDPSWGLPAQYYVDYPLPPENNPESATPRYVVNVFYTNGQLYQEGFAQGPNLQDHRRIGPYKIYAEDGRVIETGQYCECGTLDGLQQQWWPNGKLKARRNYHQGSQDGAFEEYFENGQLHRQGVVHAGQYVPGDYQEFDEQGRPEKQFHIGNQGLQGEQRLYLAGILVDIENYQHGQREGPYQRFDDDGQLREQGQYQNGKREGLVRTFSAGHLDEELHYASGELKGEQRAYYPSGQLRRQWTGEPAYSTREYDDKSFYEDGQLQRRFNQKRLSNGDLTEHLEETYFENGKLRRREQRRGRYELIVEYDQTGQLIQRSQSDGWGFQGLQISGYARDSLTYANYRNGVLQGPYRDENSGVVIEEGQYDKGLKEGNWIKRENGVRIFQRFEKGELEGTQLAKDANGKVLWLETYHKGLLHGPFNSINLDGNRLITEYDMGRLQGAYRELDEQGYPRHIGTYHQDQPDQVHYFYDRDGRLDRKESYYQGLPDGEWFFYDLNGALIRKEVYAEGIMRVRKDFPEAALVQENQNF